MESKAALRSEARAIRRSLDLPALSRTLTERVDALPEFAAAASILIYLATPNEISVEGLCDRAPEKVWSVPRIAPERKLTLHSYHPGLTTLYSGAFGIREPGANESVVEPDTVDLVIVPALLASEKGERLGYGGGYYDRLLPRLRPDCGRLVAIPEALLRRTLPDDPWDEPVDILVTEQRILRVPRR